MHLLWPSLIKLENVFCFYTLQHIATDICSMDIIYIINDLSITLLRKDVCKFTELFDMLYSSNYLFIMLHLLLLNSAVHHNALVRYCCVNEKECKLSISMNSVFLCPTHYAFPKLCCMFAFYL